MLESIGLYLIKRPVRVHLNSQLRLNNECYKSTHVSRGPAASVAVPRSHALFGLDLREHHGGRFQYLHMRRNPIVTYVEKGVLVREPMQTHLQHVSLFCQMYIEIEIAGCGSKKIYANKNWTTH